MVPPLEALWAWPKIVDIFGIAGRPADFLKIAPGPILGPRSGQNRIPREKIFRFDEYSEFIDRFSKNQNFRELIFPKIGYF